MIIIGGIVSLWFIFGMYSGQTFDVSSFQTINDGKMMIEIDHLSGVRIFGQLPVYVTVIYPTKDTASYLNIEKIDVTSNGQLLKSELINQQIYGLGYTKTELEDICNSNYQLCTLIGIYIQTPPQKVLKTTIRYVDLSELFGTSDPTRIPDNTIKTINFEIYYNGKVGQISRTIEKLPQLPYSGISP